MRTGIALKQARERAGLTTEQVGDRTKIQAAKIEALESGHFESLPHGIYLDGIVRAYAREVGIDAEPFVAGVREEHAKFFNDLYAAPRDLDGFQSEEQPADAPAATPPVQVVSPQSVPPIEADAAQRDHRVPPAHVEAAERVPPVEVEPAPVVSPVHVEPIQAGPPAAAPRQPVRHVVGEDDIPDLDLVHRDRTFDRPDALATDTDPALLRTAHEPARPARRGVGRFVLPLLAMLAAIGLGVYLYLLGPFDRDNSSATRSEPAADEIRHETEAVIAETPPDEARRQRPAPNTQSASANASRRSTPDASAPVAAPPARTGARERTDREATAGVGTSGSIPNVAGSWALATELESTSYAKYAGLRLGYELQLEQTGDRVTGAGRKITENGTGIRRRAQTPISVAGTIDGDRLTLTFTERGTRRPTQGKFVLLLDESGTMRGRFSSNAARSSGTVEARRID